MSRRTHSCEPRFAHRVVRRPAARPAVARRHRLRFLRRFDMRCVPYVSLMALALVDVPHDSCTPRKPANDGLAWRELAQKLEGGVAVDMRLRDGQHFKATFIGAQDDADRRPAKDTRAGHRSRKFRTMRLRRCRACSPDPCRRVRSPASRSARLARQSGRCGSSRWRRSTDRQRHKDGRGPTG